MPYGSRCTHQAWCLVRYASGYFFEPRGLAFVGSDHFYSRALRRRKDIRCADSSPYARFAMAAARRPRPASGSGFGPNADGGVLSFFRRSAEGGHCVLAVRPCRCLFFPVLLDHFGAGIVWGFSPSRRPIASVGGVSPAWEAHDAGLVVDPPRARGDAGPASG